MVRKYIMAECSRVYMQKHETVKIVDSYCIGKADILLMRIESPVREAAEPLTSSKISNHENNSKKTAKYATLWWTLRD